MNGLECIYPSIYSSDHLRLLEEMRWVETEGFSHLHVDIQDSSLGLNLSFGMKVVCGLAALTSMKLQVHLMVYDPLPFVEQLSELSQVDEVLFHPGTVRYPGVVLDRIHKMGARAGFALTPSENPAELDYYKRELESVLVWTGEGGMGTFNPGSLVKIRRVRSIFGDGVCVFTDGDMNGKTIQRVRAAGADHFIVGRDLFQAGDRHEKVRELERVVGMF